MGEKLSWKEAEAVVRAYRAEQGLSEDVEVATLARTLGTSPAEVRRLAGIKRRFVDRSGVLSAGLAVVVAGLLALTFGPLRHGSAPIATLPPVPTPTPMKIVVLTDGQGQVYAQFPAGTDGTSPTNDHPTDAPEILDVPDEKTL